MTSPPAPTPEPVKPTCGTCRFGVPFSWPSRQPDRQPWIPSERVANPGWLGSSEAKSNYARYRAHKMHQDNWKVATFDARTNVTCIVHPEHRKVEKTHACGQWQHAPTQEPKQ